MAGEKNIVSNGILHLNMDLERILKGTNTMPTTSASTPEPQREKLLLTEDEWNLWLQERMKEGNWIRRKLRTETEAKPDSEKKKAGRQKHVIWWASYDCDRGRHYIPQKNPSISPSKRRKSEPTMKVGCPACFSASCKWSKHGPNEPNEVEVNFFSTHEGHNPGTVEEDISISRMSQRTWDWVKERVAQGLNWQAIKLLLRLDADVLRRVRDLNLSNFTLSVSNALSIELYRSRKEPILLSRKLCALIRPMSTT
jgi:hypothetical protein